MTVSLPRTLVIGGSAGSLDVLLQLLPLLDRACQLAIIIVLHRRSDNDSMLSDLLATRSVLPVKEAEEKDVLGPGMVYVAPADYHLLIEPDGSLTLDYSEKVNYSRPSIDVTFMAAAEVFGSKLACLLLSGANTDGAEGLQVAQEMGAVTAVQDPGEAEVAFMPKHAMTVMKVDRVLKQKEMADWVMSL
ncbi:chemotaxis protein CheB [Chitinophaga sancti]|uniref:protein-glutamate methylesterase n=1 Tax=Chitinophaga sancti TaxID=1004 RepID=A0A1K1RXY3_9BACT|nr:chemotaxis protein CheB [Chitinophaga sancti]WQD64064.1 chemotaxis protein CheB [Chitinophaga sancti]WQG90312.1 chemotaxis protein CheB [Chitinophaga sancti]SFW76818.1 two-component system, chemotaxis family, response regulator CheB [Chitinophaga sancti]